MKRKYEVENEEGIKLEARLLGENTINVTLSYGNARKTFSFENGINYGGLYPNSEIYRSGNLGPKLREQIPQDQHHRLGAFCKDLRELPYSEHQL